LLINVVDIALCSDFCFFSLSHYKHIYSVSMFLVFVKVDSNKLAWKTCSQNKSYNIICRKQTEQRLKR